MSWFTKWIKKVPGFIRKIFGKKALDAFRKGARALLIEEVGRIALTVVTSISLGALTNGEKRDAAFKQIKEQAKESGLNIKDSILNLLIELALQRLKEKTGVTLLPTE